MAKKKKGVVAYFMVFILSSISILFLFGFAVPLMMDLDVGFYAAGESILNDTDSYIDQIQDADVKAQLQATLNASKESIPDQVDILGFFFQYSWLIVIVAITFIIFMYTRFTVETQGVR